MKLSKLLIVLFSLFIIHYSLAQIVPPPLKMSDFPGNSDSINFRINNIPPAVSFSDTAQKADTISIDRGIYKAILNLGDSDMLNLTNMTGYQTFNVVTFYYNYMPIHTFEERVYKTPTVFIQGSYYFPGSDLYFSEIINLTTDYNFLKIDSTGFYNLGQRVFATPPYTLINTPPIPVVLFPVDYNHPDNVVNRKIIISGGAGYNQTKLNVIVDAYGKLNLITGRETNPDTAKYDNCLRTLTHTFDSTIVGPYTTLLTETKTYNFYVPGVPDPIVSYSYSKIRSNLDPSLWSSLPDWAWHNKFDMSYITFYSLEGINEPSQKDEQINIFPNPSNGIFNIYFNSNLRNPNFLLQIIDILGNILFTTKISTHNSERRTPNYISINLAGKPKGMYLVKLITDNQPIVKKLVIQ